MCVGQQVTDYAWKYKGLFVVAVDSTGAYVGTFEYPGTDAQSFWAPPECGETHLIHRDANHKPLRAQLFWRAPPQGTGKVSFRALIKRGDPNEGSFFYPNKNGQLTLEEATTEPAPALGLAPPGASCSGYCLGRGKVSNSR